MKILVPLILWCPLALLADPGRLELTPTNRLKITLPERRVVFEVSIEKLNRNNITEKKVGEQIEAWLGKEQLPPEVLFYRPTVIRSFSLSIDGKNIPVPKNFWNDLGGLSLTEGRMIADHPTEEDHALLQEQLSDPRLRPQVSRSAHGGTVLITWARPEE